MPTTASAYPAEYFTKVDETDDAVFYQQPRFVVHIDESAIAVLTAFFDELLPEQGQILDLMSSWRSHLPSRISKERVVGLGMNAAEMTDNPQLNTHTIHNLNENQVLPYGDEEFSAVLCTVSIQYLTKPLEIFSEINRILKTNGLFVVSFSNRCFPSKAINAWANTQDADHIALVNSYFQFSGGWHDVTVRIKDLAPTDPLYMLWGYKK